MIGTLISIIASLLITYYYIAQGQLFDVQGIPFILTFAGSLFLFTGFLATALAWSQLQKEQEEINPRVEELFFRDKLLQFILFVIFLFTLFAYIVSLLSSQAIQWHASVAVVIWIILVGGSFDLLRIYVRRLMKYSSQEFLLDKMTEECLRAVRHGRESDALDWLDGLVEVAVKAMKKSSIYLAEVALSKTLDIVDGFVKNAGEIMTHGEAGSADMSLLDKVQYLSAYVAKKLEWVFKNSIREHQDPVAEEVINTFGKMSLYFVKWHPTLSHLPLGYIERCATLAIDVKNEEVVTRSCLTLSELAKTYITMARDKGESYRELIFLAFSHLESILKNNFQKNKDMYTALLMQPFAEVGQMIGTDGYQSFPDREDILKELKRILGQFNALDLVMTKTLSPLAEPMEESKES